MHEIFRTRNIRDLQYILSYPQIDGKFSDRAKEAMKNKFLLYLERAKMIKMFLAKRKNKMHLPAGQKAKEKKM